MKYSTNFFNTLLIMLCLVVLQSCTIVNLPNQNQQRPQTQLQTRQYQQREFDTNDVKLVMKAVLNTLQDDGFIARNAVVDLGLLTATKEITLNGSTGQQSANTNNDFWSALFRDAVFGNRRQGSQPRGSNEDQRFQNIKQIEASINLTQFGRQTRVRASFVARILDNKGAIMETYEIEDMKFYQDFFVKVDKGVFIEKQKF
jgi:hypothetical protein